MVLELPSPIIFQKSIGQAIGDIDNAGFAIIGDCARARFP
jgi:hypothetical protein